MLALHRQSRVAVHGGAVSAADVSAVQTSWCKFPDVPWGSGVLSWKGREQTGERDTVTQP